MADPKSPLDELNSALDEGNTPETAPEATPQGDVEVDPQNTETDSGVEVGGRVWTSVEDLDKSYRFVQSERSKFQKALTDRENEFKKYQEENREAIELSQYFKSNPEVHAKVIEFFKKVTSGEETPKQAIKSSGLSKQDPEFKQLLEWKAQVEQERQDAAMAEADKQIDAEIEDLRKTYKLDQDKLEQVLHAAQKFNKNLASNDDWVPLKDVYLMLSSKHAWRKAAKATDNVLPSPRSETIDPVSPAKTKTPEDDLLRSLDKMGI